MSQCKRIFSDIRLHWDMRQTVDSSFMHSCCHGKHFTSSKKLLFCVFPLLFISCKFVKGFLAITFLLLLISSLNFHDVCQRFLCNQKRNFSWIRLNVRNFPIDPINMTLPKLGKFFVFCRIQLQLHF